MAIFKLPTYISMAKAGMDRKAIEQRISVDLQVSKDEAAIISLLDEILSGKNEISKEILAELHSLADSKYQRLAAKGMNATQIEIIKYQDQPEKAADLGYKYDPPAVLVSFDDDERDRVIGDDQVEPERPSVKRAVELKKEASKKRKEAFESLVKQFQMESASKEESKEELTSPVSVEIKEDELPAGSTFSSKTSYPEPQVQENLGKFHHQLLDCYFNGSVVLPEKMYLLDNVLSKQECAEIISKLNFTEDEIKVQEKFLEQLVVGRVIMRTSLRRRFVNVNLAKLVWEAVKQVVPKKLEDGRELVGIRSLMNFYRYEVGQYFSTHYDGGFIYRDSGVFAEYTFLLYLNEDYSGGTTRFCDVEEWNGELKDVHPNLGRILVFRQRDMKHCGAQILAGSKFVIQGMIMYSPHENIKPSNFRPSTCVCE